MNGNYQPLYHFIRTISLLDILKENSLNGSMKKGDSIFGVSTTRNKNAKLSQTMVDGIRFKLDQNKLKKDGFKIKPFDYLSILLQDNPKQYSMNKHYKYHKKFSPDREFDNEAEEIIVGNVTPLDKYILSIDIKDNYNHIVLKDNLDLLKNYKEKYPHVKIRSYVDNDIAIVWTIEAIQKMIDDDIRTKILAKRKRKINKSY